MNVAKYLLFVLLALPVMELAAFVAVAAQIGSFATLVLAGLTSLAGLAILRYASDRHSDRIWMVLGEGSLKALRADGSAGLTLLAGFLLLIPGFITDALGLLLLAGQALGAALRRGEPASADDVVDLPPEDWRRVRDPELPDRRGNDERR